MTGSNGGYTDPQGNVYNSLGVNGTVTLAGSHFHNRASTSTFAFTVIWLVCFFALLVVRYVIHRKPGDDDNRERWLHFKLVGFSMFCMLCLYIFEIYHGVKREKRVPIRWYYPAIIGVAEGVFIGTAHGLLIAFLLWFLTPALLACANISEKTTRRTIRTCRFLTWFITLINAADTIISAIIYTIQISRMFQQIDHTQASSTELKVNSICNINDAALNAAFDGLYLLCVLIVATVAWVSLHKTKKVDDLDKRFWIYIPILMVAMVLRSAFDLIWVLVFKLGQLDSKKAIFQTNGTDLIHEVLYGGLSVVAYATILKLATLPVTKEMKSRIRHSFLPSKYRHRETGTMSTQANQNVLGDRNATVQEAVDFDVSPVRSQERFTRHGYPAQNYAPEPMSEQYGGFGRQQQQQQQYPPYNGGRQYDPSMQHQLYPSYTGVYRNDPPMQQRSWQAGRSEYSI